MIHLQPGVIIPCSAFQLVISAYNIGVFCIICRVGACVEFEFPCSECSIFTYQLYVVANLRKFSIAVIGKIITIKIYRVSLNKMNPAECLKRIFIPVPISTVAIHNRALVYKPYIANKPVCTTGYVLCLFEIICILCYFNLSLCNKSDRTTQQQNQYDMTSNSQGSSCFYCFVQQ